MTVYDIAGIIHYSRDHVFTAQPLPKKRTYHIAVGLTADDLATHGSRDVRGIRCFEGEWDARRLDVIDDLTDREIEDATITVYDCTDKTKQVEVHKEDFSYSDVA